METYQEYLNEQYKSRTEMMKDFFCKRLKELREEKKYSQKTVAHKLGCPVSTYANWEQGRTEPSIYDLYNIMWVYEIEPNELFYIESLTKYKINNV